MFGRYTKFSWAALLAALVVGVSCRSPVDAEEEPYELVRVSSLPLEGTEVPYGGSTQCELVVKERYGRPVELDETVWSYNGGDVAICVGDGASRQLMAGTPPAPLSIVAPPGPVPVRGKTCIRGTTICLEHAVTVIVQPKPPRPQYLLYTGVSGTSRDFYLLNVMDKSLVRITRDGTEKYGAELAHDGQKLAFEIRNGSCPSNLVLASADGSAAWELTKADAQGECFAHAAQRPRFSPNDRAIAFMGSWGRYSVSRPFLVSVDGSGLRLLLGTERAGKGDVVFMNNGREVIAGYSETLSEDPFTNRFVYIRKDVETEAERIIFVDATTQSHQSLEPRVEDVSADDEWVALSTPFTAKRVMLLRADGSSKYHFVTPADRNGNDPSFCGSASGEEYVYYVDRNEPNAFRRVKKDGTGDEQFFVLPHIIETPNCWRPSTP